jgi:DNA-binding SARP family transcriptional activator
LANRSDSSVTYRRTLAQRLPTPLSHEIVRFAVDNPAVEGRLLLLGPPRAEAGTVANDLPVDKPAALLYYLARRPDWVDRAELAFLFRPDAPEDVALGNVRVLLHRARSRFWPGDLTIEKTRVRYTVATDVEAFERAVETGAWEGALRLHRGPFLAGVGSAGVAGFEAWLDLERRDVATAWRRAALGLARAQLAQGNHQAAVVWLDQLVADDPLDEEAVQELLRAHLAAGDRRNAETAWNDFRLRLADELGLEPLESSQALAAALTAKEPGSALPAPTTPFVGRRAELARLGELLADDQARLITLIGLGGSGKTRLALEAARTVADRFRDGAWFVPVAGVTSAGALFPAIGAAIGWAFTGPGPLDAQLFDHLRQKEALLILDNFEDLAATPATSTLAALLETSPDLRLLVTSRAALRLGAETLFDVDGLPFPPAADDAPPRTTPSDCSPTGPRGSPVRSCWTARRLPPRRRSRAPSRGCRWRWNWPRRGSGP